MVNIKENVVWYENEGIQQSEAALQWLSEEIYPKLQPGNTDVTPERDKWNRPAKWVIEGDKWVVIVTRTYRDDKGSWAKERDNITVKSKLINNE